jgi:hypothetical protein
LNAKGSNKYSIVISKVFQGPARSDSEGLQARPGDFQTTGVRHPS